MILPKVKISPFLKPWVLASLPLPLALVAFTVFTTITCNAQEEAEGGPYPEVPSDKAIAGPNQADLQAQEGLEIEEGLNPAPNTGLTEAQQSYINNKAEEDEEISKEKADAQKEEADATLNESLEPNYGTTYGEPLVYPERVAPIVEPFVAPTVEPVPSEEEQQAD